MCVRLEMLREDKEDNTVSKDFTLSGPVCCRETNVVQIVTQSIGICCVIRKTKAKGNHRSSPHKYLVSLPCGITFKVKRRIIGTSLNPGVLCYCTALACRNK